MSRAMDLLREHGAVLVSPGYRLAWQKPWPAAVEDCYNLMPHLSPLCLTRQTGERFQLLWPERADFAIHPAESFCFREGERLYFSRWYEDPDYREEVVVRRLPDGEIVEQLRGALNVMPDGSWRLLTE